MPSFAGGTTIYIQQSGGLNLYSSDGVNYSTISFPFTITNSSPGTAALYVSFVTDMTLTSTTNYFIAGSANIQFGSQTLNANGSRPTITISGVTGYDGLIQNGSSGGFGYNNVSIYNLIVNSSGSTANTGSGWIARPYFARGASGACIIKNCSSNGNVTGGGCIVSANSAGNGGVIDIQGCTSSGTISDFGGGIIGQSCSTTTGSTIYVSSCSSSGDIGINCGGIIGDSCGINGGQVSVTNCYSTGNIDSNGGGICGSNAGSAGSVSVEACYSTGTIGNSAGGIYGTYAGVTFGGTGGYAFAKNCFSIGDINSGGGIYGASYTNAPALNCYSTGVKSGGPAGGIYYNSASDNLQGSNNYAESNHSSSGWSDVRAARYLLGAPSGSPVGNSWAQVSPGQPYRLSVSSYSPYSLSLSTSVSASIAPGGTTDPAPIPGYTFSPIVSVDGSSTNPYFTINSSTGAITADSATPLATYTLIIYATINPYSYTTFSLTITASASGSGGGSSFNGVCCPGELDLTGVDYVRRNEIVSGDFLIANANMKERRSPMSYTDMLRMKMAYAQRRV